MLKRANLNYQEIHRLILFALGIVFLLFGILKGYPLSEECKLWGKVKYGEGSAQEGWSVTAFVGQQEFAQCKIKNGEYDLCIPSDNRQTQDEKEGWAEGDSITIKVDGKTAIPRIKAEAGIQEVNIEVLSSSAEPTTWGKIKALFR